MDSPTELTEWALAHGVHLNGIAVHRMPGKGLGVMGERIIEVCLTHLCAAPLPFCPVHNYTLACVACSILRFLAIASYD